MTTTASPLAQAGASEGITGDGTSIVQGPDITFEIGWDNSVSSAPAGFQTDVLAAFQFYADTFGNPSNRITLYYNVGWGEFDGFTVSRGDLGQNEFFFGDSKSYASLLSRMTADAVSSVQKQAVSTLPASDPTGGLTLEMTSAEEKALGYTTIGAGTSFTNPDDDIGFSTRVSFSYSLTATPGANQYYFLGGVEHEISEGLGRDSFLGSSGSPDSDYSPMDLFRYAGPGERQLTTGDPSYFSINSGNADLAAWNNYTTGNTGDLGDWAPSVGNDSFLDNSNPGVINPVTATDIELLNVLGWDTIGAIAWVADANGEIGRVNTTTQTANTLGASGLAMTAVAFDRESRLFGITGSALYSINQQTGAARLIGALGAGAGDMDGFAVAASGVFYGASGATDQLYTINTATGQATALSGTLVHAAAGGIAFFDGVLYMVDRVGDLEALTITGNSVSAAIVGPIGIGGITGLATGADGVLYGVSGTYLVGVDATSGAATPLMNYAGNGLSSGNSVGIAAPTPPGALGGHGVSDLVMTNTNNGALDLDEVSAAAMTYTQIGGLGAEWQFEGVGSFLGDGKQGVLLWDSSGGEVVVAEVAGAAHYTPIGGVGAEWRFEGVGALLGQATDDFLLYDSQSGGLYVGAAGSGTAQYSLIGGLGAEWRFEGVGDYLGDDNVGFLLHDINNGGLVVGQDINGVARYTQIGSLDVEWEFEGTGELLGPNQDDFLIWNQNNGQLVVGQVVGGQAQYTAIGGLGPEWQLLGVGNYDGASNAEFMLHNSTSGGLFIGAISGGSVTYIAVGGVGSEWNFHTGNVATVA